MPTNFETFHGIPGTFLFRTDTLIAKKANNGTIVLLPFPEKVTPPVLKEINKFAQQECHGVFKLQRIKGELFVIENIDLHSSEWRTRTYHQGMRLCLLHARGGELNAE